MGSPGQSRSTDATGSERDQSADFGHFGEHASTKGLVDSLRDFGAGAGNRTRTTLRPRDFKFDDTQSPLSDRFCCCRSQSRQSTRPTTPTDRILLHRLSSVRASRGQSVQCSSSRHSAADPAGASRRVSVRAWPQPSSCVDRLTLAPHARRRGLLCNRSHPSSTLNVTKRRSPVMKSTTHRRQPFRTAPHARARAANAVREAAECLALRVSEGRSMRNWPKL
jgi:hypothetical protein